MATFAESSFSASSYASFRPQYSSTLFEKLISYHKGPSRLAIDLGCGTGISTRPLAAHFDRVIGIDPGKGMLETAESTQDINGDKITYIQGSAEDLSYLQDVKAGEVDMVVAGQAVHWFKHDKWFAEMHRILRKGGTLAYWGYSDPGFKNHRKATEILMKYAYANDPKEGLGRFWPKGRDIVRDLNRSIIPPKDKFDDVKRTEYLVDENSTEGIMVAKQITLRQMANYLSTWSSYQEWKLKHPGIESKILSQLDGGSGTKGIALDESSEDFIDRAIIEICQCQGWSLDDTVEVQFASSIVRARRV